MEKRGMALLSLAISLILISMLGNGCAGPSPQQKRQEQVGTEVLLEKSGFEKWPVNDLMPQREALLSALPKRTLVVYRRDGKTYHAYGDKDAGVIYVGDEAAYQRYLALAQGKNLCQQIAGGGESEKFWSCMDDYRQGVGGRPGK
jgi:hypothetical protein